MARYGAITIRLVCATFVVAAVSMVTRAQAQPVNTFVAGGFATPQGIARAASGNLYVTNSGNNTLSLVQPDGTVTTLLSTGLSNPNGVAIDSAGNIFVANITGPNVLKVTPGGGVTVFAGAAQGLMGPKGVAIDSAGNIYVCDIAAHAVFKFTPGGSVSTFVPSGQGLVTPAAMAFDASGNLHITDPGTAKIFKVSPGGTVSILASGFFSGEGAAFDNAGNLYTTDDANGKIYKITPAGVKTDFVNAFGPWGIVADGAGGFLVTSYAANIINRFSNTGVASVFAATAINQPAGLVIAPDGNIYVSNYKAGTVVAVSPHGQITAFASGLGQPGSIVRDGSGNFYVADAAASRIVKIAPNGTTSPFATDVFRPLAIDSAGNIFAAASGGFLASKVQKITPAGAKSDYANIGAQGIAGLAVDAGGNLYVSDFGINFSTAHKQPEITKITPAQQSSTVATGIGGALTLDGSGALYVGAGSKVTRIAASGAQSTYVSNTRIKSIDALQFDAIGNLFIADGTANAVLQVVTNPSPLLAAVLPGSRAVKVGAPATVFSTILNTGSTPLNNCRAFLSGTAPAALSIEFQTTNPVGNTLTGTKNQAVTIPANGSQSYVLGFNSNTPLQLLAMPLVYTCDGASPAPTSPGVNTIDLVFSSTDIPDIIALAATATNDGILNIPFSQGQRGAFAVATANVGIGGALTVTVDTGGATLPVTPLVCPSNPQTAACLQPEAASTQVTIAAGATPTFSVFVSASAAVPFAPDTARVYLRFLDGNGVSHGSTSVAVRTQ